MSALRRRWRSGRSPSFASRTVRAVSLASAFVLAGDGAAAQTPPVLELGRPDRAAAYGFTAISAVRELSEDSLLVVDRGEDRLLGVRWSAPDVVHIGRRGEGPGEYEWVGDLVSLSRDTTLFTGRKDNRWLLLDGWRIVATLGAGQPLVGRLGASIDGADHRGHLVNIDGPALQIERTLVRADRRSGEVQSLGGVRGYDPGGITMLPGRGGRPRTLVGGNPLRSADHALAFADGAVVVVRSTPYEVRWWMPQGGWGPTVALPFERVRVTRDEMEAAMERMRLPPGTDPKELPGWPPIVPAVRETVRTVPSLVATPDGCVLVFRTPTMARPGNRYDVVSRRGEVVAQLSLPDDDVVVGSGSRALFVVHTDELGLQTLRRYRWPGARCA